MKKSYNVGKSITVWGEYSDVDGFSEPAIVIGRDNANTFYLSQEGRDIIISSNDINDFVKELTKFVKDNNKKLDG